MSRIHVLVFFLLIYASRILPQSSPSSLEYIIDQFRSFHYQKVINLADSIFKADSTLDEEQIIELNRLQGISQFVLGQDYNAQKSFLQILDLNPMFQLDPVQNSPKIIRFFNDLKLSYLQARLLEKQGNEIIERNKSNAFNSIHSQESVNLKSALWRSVVFPGWGHYHLNRKSKGILLGLGNLFLITSTAYFSYDTYENEKDYLSAIEEEKINKYYNTYNNSYKVRNILIGSYMLFWIYTQFDISSEWRMTKEMQFQPKLMFEKNIGNTYLLNLKFQF